MRSIGPLGAGGIVANSSRFKDFRTSDRECFLRFQRDCQLHVMDEFALWTRGPFRSAVIGSIVKRGRCGVWWRRKKDNMRLTAVAQSMQDARAQPAKLAYFSRGLARHMSRPPPAPPPSTLHQSTAVQPPSTSTYVHSTRYIPKSKRRQPANRFKFRTKGSAGDVSGRAGASTASFCSSPPLIFHGTLKHASCYVRGCLPFGVARSGWVRPE